MQRRLFDADRSLAKAATPEARRDLADLQVAEVAIPGGLVDVRRLAPEDALGLLVRRGLIARTVEVPGASSIELISPGDLIQPWTAELPSFASTSWRALEPTWLMVLDRDTTSRLGRHPELLAELVGRGIRRAHTLTVSAAIESIVGVENRLLLALWHLAERYGTVTDDGVEMPLQLTHELFALLIGSRRPSVTAALASLTEQGLISRRRDRSWLLKGTPPL